LDRWEDEEKNSIRSYTCFVKIRNGKHMVIGGSIVWMVLDGGFVMRRTDVFGARSYAT
jgi:hypothetical protein